MRNRRVTWIAGAVLFVCAASALPRAQGRQASGIKADYDRANLLRDKIQNTIYHVVDTPTWVDDTTKFWYRKSVRGGNEFVLVDAAAPSKGPAFDHAKLAEALSAAAKAPYTAVTLPFPAITFVDKMQAIEFTLGGGGRGAGAPGGRGAAAGAAVPALPRWRCTLGEYRCTRLPAETGEGAATGGRGRGGATGATVVPQAAGQTQTRTSPDGKLEAFIQNYNVFVRPVVPASEAPAPQPVVPPLGAAQAPATPEATQLSWDGSEGDAYTFTSLVWSPDSKKIAAFRRRPGYRRVVTYVQSSPTDQLQPKASTNEYQKPGDVLDLDQPALFNLETAQAWLVDNALFPNPYSNSRLEWRKDSRAITFEYNQRGHQVYRVIEVDAASGKARTVIEETSQAFVDYRRPSAGLSDSGRTFRYDVADGKDVIWMSERDGWSHLYLYDGSTGRVKQQITKGNWAVHFVDKVDEEKRQIWFTANGMDAGKDPYFLHAFRINFDGTGLTRFTKADAMHVLTWSPNREYFVDSYSRVDMPPLSELHRSSDGALVMELERAEVGDLLAAGWRPPEVFVAKGRDGRTDIWGIIIRPMNFDPKKKYPVIENIYAGPQGSFVPKTFSAQIGMQTLSELGFIVVQIDGMGTANRSKAFHDVAWKNLGDAGFADRILWHKAVAAKYPWYDISRVGVYGTSAGGQNAMGAVLFHPEFYKAASASSGCHDNRMDKIWWNEQWMGWPLGPHYAASSNMENASKLKGRLLLIYGEMDTNVDPSSTLQVVNRLILANKDFEAVAIPGAGHTGGGAYGDHKRFDFFVRHLRGIEPPAWSTLAPPAPAPAPMTRSLLDEAALPWVASEDGFPDAPGVDAPGVDAPVVDAPRTPMQQSAPPADAAASIGAQSPGRLLDPSDPRMNDRAPDTFSVRLETSKGAIVIDVTRAWAPLGADRFYNLVRAGYYDGARFFRVIKNKWAQFGINGDPAVSAAWRTATIADDPAGQSNVRGTVAFAFAVPNGRTTQVFINLQDNSATHDKEPFVPFGRIAAGLDVADALNAEYGETSGSGIRAGKQGPLFEGGNAYLSRAFPRLDYIIRAAVVP